VRCDEILIRAADLDGVADPEVARHLAGCSACRDAVDAALSGRAAYVAFEDAEAVEAPPADASAAWREAHRPRERVALRWAARAAVLLLAATGGLALAGVELRPVNRPEPATALALEAAMARISARLDQADAKRETALKDVSVWLDERRREDVEALAAEIVALRRELAAARAFQDSLAGGPEPPKLRDPHH
jgi:predicted anti-sigma-YlaC factor YlaD